MKPKFWYDYCDIEVENELFRSDIPKLDPELNYCLTCRVCKAFFPEMNTQEIKNTRLSSACLGFIGKIPGEEGAMWHKLGGRWYFLHPACYDLFTTFPILYEEK